MNRDSQDPSSSSDDATASVRSTSSRSNQPLAATLAARRVTHSTTASACGSEAEQAVQLAATDLHFFRRDRRHRVVESGRAGLGVRLEFGSVTFFGGAVVRSQEKRSALSSSSFDEARTLAPFLRSLCKSESASCFDERSESCGLQPTCCNCGTNRRCRVARRERLQTSGKRSSF